MPRYDEHGLALPPTTTSNMNKNRKQKLESLRCVGRPENWLVVVVILLILITLLANVKYETLTVITKQL